MGKLGFGKAKVKALNDTTSKKHYFDGGSTMIRGYMTAYTVSGSEVAFQQDRDSNDMAKSVQNRLFNNNLKLLN